MIFYFYGLVNYRILAKNMYLSCLISNKVLNNSYKSYYNDYSILI